MRRLTIFSLMWLGGAVFGAAASSVFAEGPRSVEQRTRDAIRSGQSRNTTDVTELAASLSHESALVRQSAAWALGQLGDLSATAVPALTQALADQDARVRWAAAFSLGQIGNKASSAEAALWRAAGERDCDVRCAAFAALRSIPVTHQTAALTALNDGLQSSLIDVRTESLATASVLLPRWNADAQRRFVPSLVSALAATDDDVRLAVAVLLGDLGLSAAPAVAALAKATDDLDGAVQAASLRALERFADEVDRRWNQLDTKQRAMLRRPCELAAKTLADHGRNSEELARIAEQFRPLINGIQLTSAEELAPARTAERAPTKTTVDANQQTVPEFDPSSTNTWRWSFFTLATCVAAWVVSQIVAHGGRNAASLAAAGATASFQTEPPDVPVSEPPPESTSGRRLPDEIADRRDATSTLSDVAFEAVAMLSRAMSDEDSAVRWRSASAVMTLHEATVPQLLAAMTSNDPEVRRLAAASLLGRGANAVPPFVQALQDESAEVRHAAAITLGQIGLGALDAVPQLTAALTDGDPRVRAAAALALSSFGPHAIDAVPALQTALADESSAVRARAAFTLGQIGPPARRAVEELARLVSDPDVSVRRNSASALGGIGADAAVALTLLRQASRDVDAGVRRCVVSTLGLIDAASAITELQVALTDSDASVRRCAQTALAMVTPDQTVREKEGQDQPSRQVSELNPSLTHPASSENTLPELPPAQTAPILKLYQPEPTDEPEVAVPSQHQPEAADFIAQLEHADSDVRWQASQELTQLGAVAVPEMVASLNHRNPEVRRLLIVSLGRIGTEARAAAPALLIALHDVNGDVRCSAADCLGHLGIVSRPIVHALMQSLSDAHAEVRRYAATTLGRFGQHACEALSALQVAAISDIAAKVRSAAQTARQRISDSLADVA